VKSPPPTVKTAQIIFFIFMNIENVVGVIDTEPTSFSSGI